MATVEQIAYDTAVAYTRVLKQRELSALARENLAALQKIAKLVEENERNGNATVADVKRVRARVIDAESGASDQDYELHLAEDRFRRFTRHDPGRLKPAPNLSAALPKSLDSALAEARLSNPAILAQKASIMAARREIDAIRASGMPNLSVDGVATGKHFNGNVKSSELDVRALVTLRYKFLDGGCSPRRSSRRPRGLCSREAPAVGRGRRRGRPSALLLAARHDAHEGKRPRRRRRGECGCARSLRGTVPRRQEEPLELLEVQNSYYQARRSKIQNVYELIEAGYGCCARRVVSSAPPCRAPRAASLPAATSPARAGANKQPGPA